MQSVGPQHRSFLYSVCVSAFFVLALHAPILGQNTVDDMRQLSIGTSVDEQYYFSLMTDAAEHGKNPGSSTLFENRDAPPTASFGPLLQGSMMRYFSWDLATVVIMGNILFPFITVLFLTLIFMHLFPSRLIACCTSVIVATSIGSAFLRPVSPQITLIFFMAYLWLFCTRPHQSFSLFVRGCILFFLLFIHVVTIPPLLAAEGLRLVLHTKAGNSLRSQLQAMAWFSLPIVLALLIKAMLLSEADPVALDDLYRRLGLIPSHLPAAPLLQVKIIGTACILFLVGKDTQEKAQKQHAYVLIILCAALFIALNQSLLHGIDIIFGLYYTLPSVILLGISWLFIIVYCSTRYKRIQRTVLIILAIFGTFSMVKSVNNTVNVRSLYYQQLLPDSTSVLQRLSSLKGPQVVLAPLEISDLVPVMTPHYVVTNHYAHYQWATDAELADRYLLEQSFFPIEDRLIDKTYYRVFGLAAGNLAARERTLCSIRKVFLGTMDDCSVDIRQHIFHQELLSVLDHPTIDRLSLLKRFHVSVIITKDPLHFDLLSSCTKTENIGVYTLCYLTS